MLLVTSYFDVTRFQYLGNMIKFYGKFKRESTRFDLEENFKKIDFRKIYDILIIFGSEKIDFFRRR